MVSSRTNTNFERSDVQHHVMTLEASRVVIRISHNNKNTTVLSTLIVPYLRELYEQLFSQIKQLQRFRICILCAPKNQN